MIDLRYGDCLNIMTTIPDKSVDLILTDPPYGTTGYEWDTVIPVDSMWKELKRIIKTNGTIALFGSEPFSTLLRVGNLDEFKYDLYWIKNNVTGFVHAKNKPLKNIELISIFTTGTTVHKSQSANRMTYNPQGLTPLNKNMKNKVLVMGVGHTHKHEEYTQEFTNYPKMTIEFDNEGGFHPTQKPVKLLEYLIKTYSNENETVLDFAMGSGSTGIACMNTNRNFIGVEISKEYFNTAETRISNHVPCDTIVTKRKTIFDISNDKE